MNLPTQLTVLRIILTPIFLVLLFHNGLPSKILSLIVYIIASLTDWYDGYYARKYDFVSKWGIFLDPLADKILVSAAFIAFHIMGYVSLWVVIVIVARDFLITGLRSYALFKNKPVVTIYLAKVKTFIQMSAVYIIFLIFLLKQYALLNAKDFFILNFLDSIHFIERLMLLIVLLTIYTGIRYLIENRSHIIAAIKAFYHVFVPSDL